MDVVKEKLSKYDIAVFYGDTFIQPNDKNKEDFLYLKKRLRLSFAFMDMEDLIDGCKYLKQALNEAYDESK